MIDKDYLHENYIVLKKTSEQIGVELGCNGRTVRSYLTKYGYGEEMAFRRRNSGAGKSPPNKGIKGVYSSPQKGHTKYTHEGVARSAAAKVGKKRPDMTGENHFAWNGGDKRRNDRMSYEYIKWRKEVYKRDDYTCSDCGKRGGVLHAHHIKMFSSHPELRFDVSNGITLCYACHVKYHPDNPALKNVAKTLNHRKKLSDVRRELWANPEWRKRQVEKFKEAGAKPERREFLRKMAAERILKK